MCGFLFIKKVFKKIIEKFRTIQSSKITYSAEEVDIIYKMALKNGAEPSFILWFNEFKKR
jgi:hypothetical protein